MIEGLATEQIDQLSASQASSAEDGATEKLFNTLMTLQLAYTSYRQIHSSSYSSASGKITEKWCHPRNGAFLLAKLSKTNCTNLHMNVQKNSMYFACTVCFCLLKHTLQVHAIAGSLIHATKITSCLNYSHQRNWQRLFNTKQNKCRNSPRYCRRILTNFNW